MQEQLNLIQEDLKKEIRNIPPIEFKRNKYGLLENVKYIYTEDGYVDWKSMIPKEFLYINSSKKDIVEKKYGKPLSDIDVILDKVEDIYLVIKLGGLKYLLRLRGYINVLYTVTSSSIDYASVSCNIDFIPNFETNRVIRFSDCACSHKDNTKSFGQHYLVEIATNRAFCRTVRSFLNINIVSQEELGAPLEVETKVQEKKRPAQEILESKMSQASVTFDAIKKNLIKESYVNKETGIKAEDINSLNDIDTSTLFKLTERVVKKLNKNND